MTQIPRPETRQESAVRRYLIALRFDALLVFATVRTFRDPHHLTRAFLPDHG